MEFCVLFSYAEIGYLPGVPWPHDKLTIIFNILLTALFHLMPTDALGNFLIAEDSSSVSGKNSCYKNPWHVSLVKKEGGGTERN